MALSRRVKKVSSLIRKELSFLFLNGIRDTRVNKGMITITNVDVSGDLQHCKVFVSILGDQNHIEDILDGLNSAKGFLRGEIGRRLQMRRAPEISFALDSGLKKGANVLTLLGELAEERNQKNNVDL
tara:strand:- start:1063 stop:1443 length:381 start_codon:yes stop_codon:yes gene_type:complete